MTKRKPPSKKTASDSIRIDMRMVLVLVGGLIALIVGVVLATRQPPYTPEYTGGARAELDQTVLDFGDVQFNKSVNAVFKVRNVGDAPLRLLNEPQVELVQGC